MSNVIESMEPDYEGFVREYDERVEKGFPIDMTTLREMAEKYKTPRLDKCEHSDSAFIPWEPDPDFEICKYCGAVRATR